MKKFLVLLIMLMTAVMVTSAAADEPTVYTSGNYKYILLDDGTVKITRYTGQATELTIPAKLDSHSVTAIGAYFLSTDSFAMDRVTTVTIPDSVTTIEEKAFAGSTAGLYLTDIYVSIDHPTLATIDGVLFEKSTKMLLRFPCSNDATDYVIPQGICIIGEEAFYRCKSLSSITIPDSVTSIGSCAFRVCSSLTSIIIPDSVIFIGDGAFSNCTSLTSVTIPSSVTSIANFTFQACTSLSSITIPDSVTSIGDDAFYDCPSLTTIIVGRDSYARQYCIDHGLPYTYADANDWLLD